MIEFVEKVVLWYHLKKVIKKVYYMDNSKDKQIELSNKIYPIFYGLSSDLIFFIAINTLFLTNVKGLTSSEINFMTTVGVLVALVFYFLSHKIINKIGNLYSIRLGTLLLLISSLLFTFSTNLIFLCLAEIFYEVSFIFKSVDQVVLNNNLVYQNKENDFIKIKTKATTIYSIATMIATSVAGFLFNINPYLPMFICILICFNNFIMAHYICDVSFDNKELELKKKHKFNFNKIMIITILVYGLIYGTLDVCQTNDKLFIQYELQDFLKTNSVTLVMSVILFLSRVSRLILNLIFGKIYDKFKNKTLYIIYFGLLISVSLFVVGKIFLTPMYSSIIMAVGFILLLSLRDPTENLLSDILLKNTNKEDKEKAILYFQFARRLVVFMLSLLATMIFVKYELIHLYIVFLTFVLLYIFLVLKLLSLINNKSK
mgnify:CR=1 FL=1